MIVQSIVLWVVWTMILGGSWCFGCVSDESTLSRYTGTFIAYPVSGLICYMFGLFGGFLGLPLSVLMKIGEFMVLPLVTLQTFF
ncbi:MAG: hypothetical protein HGB03_02395 [Candidatus Yonathbacteria bacterium]|nr:hypothetical protein [Candidatus Yonathbacteria bacterium]NTW47509.1 hypothetical protein [Candidatus Yonathbacteria bacterium]